MVVMKAKLRWGQIEYQPSLTSPVKPIPLGVLVHLSVPGGGIYLLLGRQPERLTVSPEFMNLGDLGMDLVCGWFKPFARDMADAVSSTRTDVFEELASRWRQNLYIAEPKTTTLPLPSTRTALQLAKNLYQEHVQEPFVAPPPAALLKPTVKKKPSPQRSRKLVAPQPHWGQRFAEYSVSSATL
jgi:hypothetical protein